MISQLGMPSTGRPFFSAVSMPLPAWSAMAEMHAGDQHDVGERRQRGVAQMLLQLRLAPLRGAEAQVSIQPPCPTPSESFTRQMPREVSRKKVGGTRCVHGVGLFSRLR